MMEGKKGRGGKLFRIEVEERTVSMGFGGKMRRFPGLSLNLNTILSNHWKPQFLVCEHFVQHIFINHLYEPGISQFNKVYYNQIENTVMEIMKEECGKMEIS